MRDQFVIAGSKAIVRFLSAGLFLAGAFGSLAGANEVAGTNPANRPADAPVITEVDHGEQWRKNALRGVSEPYPASLGFLDDQGHWYTPFNHPNMPGVYDIRGLYGASGN
ncbi:MAG: hypothetical protein R3C97_12815 [Geminicoccaceae bacterium]